MIPRELRRAAGFEPGMPLELRVEDGAVIIEPAPTPVRIERRGRFLVARTPAGTPPLTNALVQQTREQIAAERGGQVGPKKR